MKEVCMNWHSFLSIWLPVWLTTSCALVTLGIPSTDSVDCIPLDDGIQKGISNAVDVLTSPGITEKTLNDVLDDLLLLDASPHTNLLLQVLATYGSKEEHRRNPRRGMARRWLLARLASTMSRAEIVDAVAPKFEGCAIPVTENTLCQALGMALFHGSDPKSDDQDLSYFANYVRKRGDELPQKLVRYVFGKNPGCAALSLTRAYGTDADEKALRRQMGLSPEIAMPSLSKDPRWWVRLYVAIRSASVDFGLKREILQELTADSHPIVKETACETLHRLDEK